MTSTLNQDYKPFSPYVSNTIMFVISIGIIIVILITAIIVFTQRWLGCTLHASQPSEKEKVRLQTWQDKLLAGELNAANNALREAGT